VEVPAGRKIRAEDPEHPVREALACRETGEPKVILTALCGHGHFDLAAYLAGRMTGEQVSDARFAAALADLPQPASTFTAPAGAT